jgi:hypothetical protein
MVVHSDTSSHPSIMVCDQRRDHQSGVFHRIAISQWIKTRGNCRMFPILIRAMLNSVYTDFIPSQQLSGSTFLRGLPFKHVSTVKSLADPEPIEPLITAPGIAIGNFEGSTSSPSKLSHGSGSIHFCGGNSRCRSYFERDDR